MRVPGWWATKAGQAGVQEARRALNRSVAEKDLQAAVEEALTRLGWLWYHAHISIRDNPGFPDVFCVRGRRLVAIELKRQDAYPTVEQRRWLERLTFAGCETYVVRPSGLTELLEVLK